jgi:hypothetical protein
LARLAGGLPAAHPPGWLNQVEMWFPTLQRRLLRRGDFPSAGHLEAQIVAFVATHKRLFADSYP